MEKETVPMSTDEKPLISVIIPVYNVENFLSKCIESIIKQTYTNLEILLIDDGSTDKSGEICDDVVRKDNRIRVFHKSNGGLSDARNYGIEHAIGEFITFVDSDDYIAENCISQLFELTKRTNTKIAVGSHTVFYESGKTKYKGLGKGIVKIFAQKEVLEHILLDDGLDLSAWAKLYSIDLFKEIRYPKNLSFEDTATTYKLFFQCDKISYIGNSIYFYRKRSNSITTSGNFSKKMELISNTQQMCSDIVAKYPDLLEAADRRLVWAYFSTLNQLLKCPDKKNYKKEEKEIVEYLKSKRTQIKTGTGYSKRDKLASSALSFGVSFYNLIWKAYSAIVK